MEASKPDDDEALAALLEANGLTYHDLGNVSTPILDLEMFLQHYPKMLGLQHFSHLSSLKLIDQCIEKIEGLSGCPKLQKLWLMENKITKIEGLEACTNLRELYLYSNRISKIEGLDHLTGLQVLWLADNFISSISGLSKLQQLQQLNLARNDISTTGSSLLLHSALTSLNLAGNKISSFQDVANLAKVAGLQELCLADPFWGDCPVAGLYNYQTFVLYLMPQLTSLDTLVLAEETKTAAVTTFTKKQLYYNMRMRTLRRAAAGLIRQAKTGCQVHGSRWTQLLSQLACAAKGIERQLWQTAESEQQMLQEQLSNLQSAVRSVLGCQAVLLDSLTADIQLSAAAVEHAVARLKLELSSGGNIRLEEATPDESWLLSCQELLRNRLMTAASFGGVQGILDIQVVSVARIHNRHLRLQFDSASDKAGEIGSKSNKQCTDFLFYGEHPALPGELMRVAQTGFRCSADYSRMGLDGAVRLASCVNLADQLRMQQAMEVAAANRDSNERSTGSFQVPSCVLEGQLLVCKVHLGGVLQDAGGRVQLSASQAGATLLGKDGSIQTAACLDGFRIEQQQYPGASAVYRTAAAVPSRQTITTGSSSCQTSSDAAGLSQHRVWYLFDHAAALPEYLVSFRYTITPGSPLAMAAAASNSGVGLPSSSGSSIAADIMATVGGKQQDPLLLLCARPLLPWLQLAAASPQQQGSTAVSPNLTAQQLQAGAEVEQRCTALLAAAFKAVPKKQIAVLAPAALAAFVGGQLQLSSLTHLSLHDCGLTSCGALLGHLPALSNLVLSFNSLTGLHDLVPCSSSNCQLTSLDVSYNQISSWQGEWLAACDKLTALDASWNQLQEVAHLNQLVRSVPQLWQLHLTGNPVQQSKAYKVHLARDLPQLQQLDGKQAVRPTSANNSLLPAVMQAGAAQWHSGTGPVAVLPCTNTKLADVWQPLLHSLVVEGKGLYSLSGLAAASRLVCASFADNVLTGLSGLQGCIQLRDLNISNNLITELSPLSTLSSLQQLDASFNSISSLLPLASLTRLSQLNVEGNQFSSLAGLAELTGLLELYAADNAVSDIKEAQRLAVLPRLVILDLVANPLVTVCQDYRHLLLYRLRHLKVLDGVSAEAGELAAARAKYSGRLTMSYLEEQLGGSCTLSAIRSLDVSRLRIRDVGAVFAPGTPFALLAELILDNNMISSLASLRGLTALQVLKMNNNKLGDADPSCISFAAAASPLLQSAVGQPAASFQQQQLQLLLPNLQVLHIGGNGLTSLRPLQLQYLPALRSLFVHGNELQRLDALEGLAHLRELVADKNKIRVLEADELAPLVRLRELRLEDNQIKSLAIAAPATSAMAADSSGLAGFLTSLSVLQLSGNRLCDLNELQRLTALPSLLEIGLAGNPLTRKQVYRPLLISRCSQLQLIDRQQVTAEEREYAEAMFAAPPLQPTPMGSDNALGLLAAVTADRGAWAPLSAAPASSVGLASNPGSPNRSVLPVGKLSTMALPVVTNYEAFAQLAANSAGYAGNAAAGGLGGGLALPGVVSSVPSIQSGVLVLSGTAAFGLEGMSIGNSISNGRNVAPAARHFGPKQRPSSAGRRAIGGGGAIAGAAGSDHSRRRVTGPAYLGSGSGSPQRQVVYRGY